MEINILDLINLPYSVSVVLLTWVILSKLILNPKKWLKIVISLTSGLVLGFAFYKFNDVTITTLIVSYLVSIVAYTWIIKTILDKFNINYDNKKGVI